MTKIFSPLDHNLMRLVKMVSSYSQVRSFFATLRNHPKYQEVVEFPAGKKLTFEAGCYAKLADGSAVATVGQTSVLVTSVSKSKPGLHPGFMPLTVDYRQKYAAAGRIPSNYLRRELAPTDKEILTSRVIDRSLRPLFPSNFFHDTQITCQLLAVDRLQEPDVISINAASASLALSNIPWNGPVGAVRVGIINGEAVIFPTRKELADSSLNLIITATNKKHIVMVEGSGMPVSLNDLKRGIKIAAQGCQQIVEAIQLLALKGAKMKKLIPPLPPSEELETVTRSLSETKIKEIFLDSSHDKLSRDNALNAVRLDVHTSLSQSFAPANLLTFNEIFNAIVKQVFRGLILDENIRCDGRAPQDLRPISCAVDLFKPLHGSSLFQRGQTQVQCTVAYDSPDKGFPVDPLLEVTGGLTDRNFLLHYSFPSFANNELSRGGPTSRREIGHGALAAKGLRPLLPKDNPFCILLTSTVMESNGSSSMATVCGGSLALMDAGVDVPSHAAGVAIGLVTRMDQNGEVQDYKLITDILGIEDYMGDMDLKVAGTKDGITALQADIKVPGISCTIIMEAIDQAIVAKKTILAIMNKTLSKPSTKKYNLPVIITKEIPASRRGVLRGPGGMKLRMIQEQCGVQVTWEDEDKISIFATNQDAMDEALHLIEECIRGEPDLEFGAIYNAKIVDIRPQGVMVTFYKDMTPTLLHNSQLDVRKVKHPTALDLEVGNEIKVKYLGRDPTSGQMRLSRRALQTTAPGMRNLLKGESS